MTRKITAIIISILILLASGQCYALGLSASSAIVIEKLTGDVVYEKNAHKRMPMASTTKIMTAICALENGNTADMVKVHPSAVNVEGSSMYLGYDEVISLEDLVYGLMLASGNDAAVAIAVHISGSVENFAALMNETAAKIGANDTSFKNPNGLDEEGHYTTASDLAKITRYALSNETFARIVSSWSKKVPWQGKDYDRQLKNHNKLLKMYDGCNGVKTGFTKKSGRCLVSSAVRDGVEVIAVTLNAPNDWNDHTVMLDYAFESLENKQIIKADDYVRFVKVLNGASERIKTVAKSNFYIPVKNGITPEIEMHYNIPDIIEAPVDFGQVIGKVEIYRNGELLGAVDVISDESCAWVEQKSFFKYIKKIFTSFVLMHRRTC